MRAITFVLLSCLVLSAFAGKCALIFNSFSVDKATTTCPQYADDTCCPATFTETSCSTYDGCRRIPDTCSYLMGLFTCGLTCKPDFVTTFYDGLKVRLCENYYDALEKACLDVKECARQGNSSVDCRQNANADYCQNVYDSSQDFWNKFQPLGAVRASDNCFAAGMNVLPSFVLLAVALILAFFH